MPSIKDKSTRELIAYQYTGPCKRNKTRAMIAVGYDEGYARSGDGQRSVYANIRVKQAIERIDAENKEISEQVAGMNDEFVMRKLLAGLSLAETKRDLVAIARFTELIGKTRAMFKDKVITDTTEQAELSEQAAHDADELLKLHRKQSAGPQLHKDTG